MAPSPSPQRGPTLGVVGLASGDCNSHAGTWKSPKVTFPVCLLRPEILFLRTQATPGPTPGSDSVHKVLKKRAHLSQFLGQHTRDGGQGFPSWVEGGKGVQNVWLKRLKGQVRAQRRQGTECAQEAS